MADLVKVAERIKQAAREAHTEADFSHAFMPILREVWEAEGLAIQWSPHHEKRLSSGRADAVFGHMIFEFKDPGRLGKTHAARANQEAIEGLKRYLSAQAGDDEDKKTRQVGVALDGYRIFFLRWQRGDWRLEATDRSYEVNQDTIRRLLEYLRGVGRKRLSPETLNDDFGPRSDAAGFMVRALVSALLANAEHPKIQTMFGEWDRIFGIVYGQEVGKGKAAKDHALLAEAYEVEEKADLKQLLFAVHTYFALFVKLLAAELLTQQDWLQPSFIRNLPAATEETRRAALTQLEEGGTYAAWGITNFLEADFFGWYLEVYDQDLDRAVGRMLSRLCEYEPLTGDFMPEETRDLLKRLYQYLVPKKLRHDLGEYYTPDWLAELVLNEVGYEGDPDQRILDPACGSGTFPVLCIRRARQYGEDRLLDRGELLEKILSNIVGFELNPLAVIAARANYLMAIRGLLEHRRGPVRLPVYLCDSILTPTEHVHLFARGMAIPTTQGEFAIPEAIIAENQLEALAEALEFCVGNDYEADDFLDYLGDRLSLSPAQFAECEDMLKVLYLKIAKLQAQGKNRIWARLLKNAFAPVFQGKFDFVVGNPPWVNWEHLSTDYREATAPLWNYYGLFTQEGYRALVPAGKLDLAMLFTYVSADEYLEPNGRLGFVITQTVFKSKGADGFRRFVLPDGRHLGVYSVNDVVDLKPFEAATNRSATIALERDSSTSYPVPYTIWERTTRSAPDTSDSLQEVTSNTRRTKLGGSPIREEGGASWVTVRAEALEPLGRVVGDSPYRARAGVYTRGANGIYWVEVLDSSLAGSVIVRNLHDCGRKKFGHVEGSVEADLVYPLLRGRDVARWHSTPAHHILLPHSPTYAKLGLPEQDMRRRYPQAYAFFRRFYDALINRSMFDKIGGQKAFYALFEIGPYTFAPWKVVWKGLAKGAVAAVVGTVEVPSIGERCIIPEHNTMMVPFDCAKEAHYFCALFNSSPASLVIQSYIAWFYSTHVLDNIAIPKFDPKNEVHRRLAELSERAHKLAALGEAGKQQLVEVEAGIDRAAAQLWGLSDSELAIIQETLQQLS